MMKTTFPVLALLCCFAVPAQAQWTGAIGAGARHFSNAEYNAAGRRLVLEKGWLPGLQGRIAYAARDWMAFGEVDVFDRSISYHGQSQFGAPVDSRTATRLADVRLGAGYVLNEAWVASAAVEWHKWSRDIQSTATARGLQETYTTTRLLLGLEGRREWEGAGSLHPAVAIVFASPEKLRVGFSGVLDDAALRTKSATGIRAGLGFRPAGNSRFEIRADVDWMKVRRSGDVEVTRSGQFMGTISQPEHTMKSLTLAARYFF